jgi:GNAT superfamily N-acetyltransferase
MINKLELPPAVPHLFDGHFDWLNAENFLQAHDWWDIYTQSFPIAERDTKQQFLKAIHQNIALIGGYRIHNTMAAIIVLYRMQKPAFGFLHFFAVAKDWRNKSLGSKLFQMIVFESEKFVLKNNPHTLGLIWEVEDPEAADSDLDKHVQSKRINFYLRLGGKIFDSKFIQPAINNQRTVPMLLMCHTTQKILSEQAIAKAIYFQKYQIINNIKTPALNDLLNQCYANKP